MDNVNNVIRMPLPKGLPFEKITKNAMAEARKIFDTNQFPKEVDFPSGLQMEYVEHHGEPLTKVQFGNNAVLFRGKITELPKIVISWKISRITLHRKVYAAPTF